METSPRELIDREFGKTELVGDGWEIPEDVRELVEFHWFHASPNKSLVLAILSPKPKWYIGHYVGGRMMKCAREECNYCHEDIGTQARFVFGVAEVTTGLMGVIELSKEIAVYIKAES